MTKKAKTRVLLVDLDDARRQMRVHMLTGAGYEVETRGDHELSEALKEEGTFDLVILALHKKQLNEAAACSERLRKRMPTLPILLLLDAGVFVPHGTLSPTMETGFPFEMMTEIAAMIAASEHIRELPDHIVPAE